MASKFATNILFLDLWTKSYQQIVHKSVKNREMDNLLKGWGELDSEGIRESGTPKMVQIKLLRASAKSTFF
jgi:hypothetical protein